MSQNELYFIAGIYGVGKSTLCEKMSKNTGIPHFSASDLISNSVGESYGANKSVTDKIKNQNILASKLNAILCQESKVLLSGHFCIFNKAGIVERLPEFVYSQMSISKIVLLESETDRICRHLRERDNRDYSIADIENIKTQEREYAKHISSSLNIQFLIYQMMFDESDIKKLRSYLNI